MRPRAWGQRRSPTPGLAAPTLLKLFGGPLNPQASASLSVQGSRPEPSGKSCGRWECREEGEAPQDRGAPLGPEGASRGVPATAGLSSRLGVQGEAAPQRPSHPDSRGGAAGPGAAKDGGAAPSLRVSGRSCAMTISLTLRTTSTRSPATVGP